MKCPVNKNKQEPAPKPLKGFFGAFYQKLFRINDTPQRIALGLGLGVFSGILPGTGPIAALFLAFLLRVNRASALLGSLATNTWLSVVTFLLSVKLGSVIMKLDWQEAYQNWLLFLKEFHWSTLLRLSILKVILPVIVGYFVVAFCSGLVVYVTTLIILKYANKSRIDLPRCAKR